MATRKKGKATRKRKGREEDVEESSPAPSTSSAPKCRSPPPEEQKLVRWVAIVCSPNNPERILVLNTVNLFLWRMANIVSTKCCWCGTNWDMVEQEGKASSLVYFSMPANFQKFVDFGRKFR